MFKAIIVDDEYNIREGLKTIIDWEKWGFKIVGQASDGIEALELYHAKKPSLVITDIKMPRMDGIQLIKEIRSVNPNVKVLVLSGYNDFIYAKEAMKYNVSNYLLKPVDIDELCLGLSKIYEAISKRLLENTMENIKLNNLKNYFLCKMINGQLLKSDILKMAEEHGIQTDDSSYTMAIIQIANYDDLVLNLTEAELQTTKFAIQNILEENIEINKYGFLFEISERDYGIILTGNIDLYKKENINTMISEFTGLIKENTQEEILMAIGEPVNSIFEINTSYKKSVALLEEYALNTMTFLNKKKNSLEDILQYIQLNFKEDINLKRLSEKFFISSAYLGQIFKKETGKYFHEYINKIRIELAKKLIEEGGLSMNEVSQKVGYKYVDHFYRNFKNQIGCNPGDYKKVLNK